MTTTTDRLDFTPDELDVELLLMRARHQQMLNDELMYYPRIATQHRLALRIVCELGPYSAVPERVAKLGGWSTQRARVLLAELERFGWIEVDGRRGPFWSVRTPAGSLPDVVVTAPAVAPG